MHRLSAVESPVYSVSMGREVDGVALRYWSISIASAAVPSLARSPTGSNTPDVRLGLVSPSSLSV